MKILAFNASPRKNRGNTDLILDHFLDAAKEAGAETEKHYVYDLNVNSCVGCFTCWTKTPGKCVHNDDMDWLIPQYIDADIVVHATPIYNGNIISRLQQLKERFLPMALPFQVEHGDVTRHPPRVERKPQKTVLIASAGFPDHQAFDVAKLLYPSCLHITLPATQILADPKTVVHVSDFVDAVHTAARLMVEGKEVGAGLVDRLNVVYSEDMRKLIREGANSYFEDNIPE